MKNIDRSIFKKTLLLAIPIMIQNGISNAVGLVDNLMVGSQGTEAIVAVSIAGQLMFVFWLVAALTVSAYRTGRSTAEVSNEKQ